MYEKLSLAFYNSICQRFKYTPIRYKRYNLVWPFWDHFWSFFCQLHEYFSQNLGFDIHFDVLNVSKFQSDQKIQHK